MWEVLAIAPTDDARAIRRAYAARLREIDPDRDREAFARLRAALESALAGARAAVRQAPSQPPREEAPADTRPPALPLDDEPPRTIPTVRIRSTLPLPPPAREAVPEIAGERTQERALLIALESALQRRDARGAAQHYFRAAATGAVPLGDTERMLVRLFTVALEDASFDGAAFRGLANTLGWVQPQLDTAAVSDVRQRVLARLAAEDWYDDLVATAARKKPRTPRFQARAARLILRRMRAVGLLRINRPALRVLIDQLKPHEACLRDRIAPEWIATLEYRMRRRDLIASGLIVLFIGSLLLNSIAALVAALGAESSPGFPLLAVVAVGLAWLLKHLVVNFVTLWRRRVP
jgi:hypothetical protein